MGRGSGEGGGAELRLSARSPAREMSQAAENGMDALRGWDAMNGLFSHHEVIVASTVCSAQKVASAYPGGRLHFRARARCFECLFRGHWFLFLRALPGRLVYFFLKCPSEFGCGVYTAAFDRRMTTAVSCWASKE